MDPPIYQCQTGHLICPDCLENPDLETCPTCSKPYDKDNPIRNGFAEKIAADLPKPCRYLDNGCPEQALISGNGNKANHERNCIYRPIPSCPANKSGCRSKVLFKDIANHIHNGECGQQQQSQDADTTFRFGVPCNLILPTPIQEQYLVDTPSPRWLNTGGYRPFNEKDLFFYIKSRE